MGSGMVKEEGSLIFCSSASTPGFVLGRFPAEIHLAVQVLVLIVEVFELAVLDHDGGSRLEILHITRARHLDDQAVVFARNIQIEVELVGQRRGLDGVGPAIILAGQAKTAGIRVYRGLKRRKNSF